MAEANYELRTSALWERLFKEPCVDSFLDEYECEVDFLPFHEYISSICRERGEAPDRVIRRADIEKSYGHSLFRGSRRPSRDMVIQLAFGFCADFDLAQDMLKHAGLSPLYPRVQRDLIIGFCLKHGESFLSTQALLAEKGMTPIGGRAK